MISSRIAFLLVIVVSLLFVISVTSKRVPLTMSTINTESSESNLRGIDTSNTTGSRKEWKLMESQNKHHLKGHSYEVTSVADPQSELIVVFAPKQNNIEELALSIADPASPNYGKHLSKQQVDELTIIPEAVEAVMKYLHGNNIQIESNKGGYINAKGTVEQFNNILNANFHNYVNDEGHTLIRTENYSLPVDLAENVAAVFNTVQFPVKLSGRPISAPKIHLSPHHGGKILSNKDLE